MAASGAEPASQTHTRKEGEKASRGRQGATVTVAERTTPPRVESKAPGETAEDGAAGGAERVTTTSHAWPTSAVSVRLSNDAAPVAKSTGAAPARAGGSDAEEALVVAEEEATTEATSPGGHDSSELPKASDTVAKRGRDAPDRAVAGAESAADAGGPAAHGP